MPTEVVAPLLGMLGVFGTWLSIVLTRRGKREDVKLQRADQAFDHMRELAETRSADLARVTGERDAGWAEVERVRSIWEARWDRQMARCREVTSGLVATITELRQAGHITGEHQQRVEQMLQRLDEHNEDHR